MAGSLGDSVSPRHSSLLLGIPTSEGVAGLWQACSLFWAWLTEWVFLFKIVIVCWETWLAASLWGAVVGQILPCSQGSAPGPGPKAQLPAVGSEHYAD